MTDVINIAAGATFNAAGATFNIINQAAGAMTTMGTTINNGGTFHVTNNGGAIAFGDNRGNQLRGNYQPPSSTTTPTSNGTTESHGSSPLPNLGTGFTPTRESVVVVDDGTPNHSCETLHSARGLKLLLPAE
jgi:hypothetical protein